MKSSDTIFLIGMMGAGKSTIGRMLAKRLNKHFVDCDHEIEVRTGVKIPVIFEKEGEKGFRRRETQVLHELAHEPGLVVATGGGVVLAPENRACLSQYGLVIYLSVPPQNLWERTRYDTSRPLLQVENPRKRIEELHDLRDPLYREVADITIAGGRLSQTAVLKLIEKELQDRCVLLP